MGKLLALLTNVRLARKNLPHANTQAYFLLPSVMKKKSFVTLSPGVDVIKLFYVVTDDEAQ
jgi:hypothetical protein